MPDLLTVADVAKLLGVNHQRVRQLLASGRLAGQKLGWAWVVERKEAEAFARLDRPHHRPAKPSIVAAQ